MSELIARAHEHPLWAHRQSLLLVAFGLMAVEIVVLGLRFGDRYRPGLMLSTALMWFVEQGGRLLMYPMRLAAFAFVAHFALIPEQRGPWVVPLLYVAVDGLYYWKHRLL